jgi:outer membrane protein assembly factor BamB
MPGPNAEALGYSQEVPPGQITPEFAQGIEPAPNSLSCLAAFCLLFLFLSFSATAHGAVTGNPGGQVLTAGERRVMILSPEGEVLWQYPTQLTHDVWMLADGHVLFADGETVTEVTPEKKVVFQYRARAQKGGGTYSCQRLANGDTLIGENSTGRVLEVNRDGRIVFALQTTPYHAGEHHNLRMARKLANGNYLVCHSGARVVKEYTPQGEVVWQVKAPGTVAFAAVRTPRETTLVSSLDQVTEFDAAGKTVWQFSINDAAGVSPRNLTGFHLLPDGRLIVGCYRAYDQGRGCGLLEVSRDKQPLWTYSDPRADGTMMPVELLTPEGKALPGECLR